MKKYKEKINNIKEFSSIELINTIKFLENISEKNLDKIFKKNGFRNSFYGNNDNLLYQDFKFEKFFFSENSLSTRYTITYYKKSSGSILEGYIFVKWDGHSFIPKIFL